MRYRPEPCRQYAPGRQRERDCSPPGSSQTDRIRSFRQAKQRGARLVRAPRCRTTEELRRAETNQARLKPDLEIGSERRRLPVALKIALAIAGSTGGSAGSPIPVGLNVVFE